MKLLNVEKYTQKQLKFRHLLTMGFYALFAFVAPIVTVLSWSLSTNMIKESHKWPLIVILIIAIFAIAACHFLKKSIDKINILNLDGTYNEKSFKIKLILKFICSAIVPIILLVGCVFAKKWFVSTVEEFKLYMNIIMVCTSFVIVSKIIDNIFIEQLEIELDIRAKTAEQNAISRRIHDLENIK